MQISLFHFSGHDYVRLVLDQSKCANEAVIANWRVTVCQDWNKNVTQNCQNSLHRLTFFNRGKREQRGYLQIRGLQECQLYTVAITPTNPEERVLY